MHDDKVEYVSISEIFPAQIRYSTLNMKDKANRAIIKGDAIWNDDAGGWTYKFNDSTSILSHHDALPVVHTSFGYVLIDGHHDVLSSMHLQATTAPIKIVEDMRHLSVDDFWREADERGWSYLYTIEGNKVAPPTAFYELLDDPNRYFAAITARKFTSNEDGTYISKGAEYPLWVKVNKDIPFIEFKISNALYEAGFVYNPDHMGNPPAESVTERARQIIIDAEIEGLRVVPYRIHHEKFSLHDDYVKIKVPGPDIKLKAVPVEESVIQHRVNPEIENLKAYIKKVESHKKPDGTIDFAHGFRFFKRAQAHSREANYNIAKGKLTSLICSPS